MKQEHINCIKALFTLKQIKKVIYVDDSLGIESYKDNFSNYVRQHATDKDSNLPFQCEKDVDIALSTFGEWWGNSEDTIKEKYVKEYNINRSQDIIEQKLHQIVEDGMLECLTPMEFVSEYTNKPLTATENDQIVILMDQQIGGGRNGFDLLKTLHENPYVHCGLFSEKFRIEDEIHQWEDLCSHAPNIYPISKDRLNDDEEEKFVPGLRNVIWLSQISSIKDTYTKIMYQAFDHIKSDIKNLDPSTFDKVVMDLSSSEGCWEFETLHQMGEISMQRGIQKTLVNETFEIFQKGCKLLREIKSNSPMDATSNQRVVNEFEQDRWYLDGHYINKIHSQLSNGDIFKVYSQSANEGKEKLYILLCQPCNLEIRGNNEWCGKRKAGDHVYLVKMEKCDNIDAKADSESEVIVFNSEKYRVRFNNSYLSSTSILDLCVFNENGDCKIDLNVNDCTSSLLQPNLRKRYQDIYKYIKSYDDRLSALRIGAIKQQLGDHYKTIEKEFCNPGCKGQALKKPVKNKSVIDFGAQRIARCKDPYAQDLLQSFMGYLCRPAHPMNFTR